MKVIRGTRGIKEIRNPVLTLGNFDGLHLGHQRILRKVSERARKLGCPSVVYTFEPHPLKVVSPARSPQLIIGLEDKLELIGSFGIDYVVLARFTKGFASKRPREFVEEVLVKGLGVREVWVGHDYSFGRGKRGTVEYLSRLGEDYGFAVHVIPAYRKGGEIVSSSRVRELIKAGRVREAGTLLGRDFTLRGRVVKGRNIGRTLGFPTANLRTRNELIPGSGVYAAYILLDGERYPAVVNIGTAPTFKRRATAVEVHILDFKGSIYGKDIRVAFVRRIRGERCFKDPVELARRIERDVERARTIFARITASGRLQ